MRTRLIGLLAAGVMLLAVATSGAPGASAAAGATCTLVSYKVSGLRSYNYKVTVRMSNLTSSYKKITTTLADQNNKNYKVAAGVRGGATVTMTKTFSASPGTTFKVVACSQK